MERDFQDWRNRHAHDLRGTARHGPRARVAEPGTPPGPATFSRAIERHLAMNFLELTIPDKPGQAPQRQAEVPLDADGAAGPGRFCGRKAMKACRQAADARFGRSPMTGQLREASTSGRYGLGRVSASAVRCRDSAPRFRSPTRLASGDWTARAELTRRGRCETLGPG